MNDVHRLLGPSDIRCCCAHVTEITRWRIHEHTGCSCKGQNHALLIRSHISSVDLIYHEAQRELQWDFYVYSVPDTSRELSDSAKKLLWHEHRFYRVHLLNFNFHSNK